MYISYREAKDEIAFAQLGGGASRNTLAQCSKIHAAASYHWLTP